MHFCLVGASNISLIFHLQAAALFNGKPPQLVLLSAYIELAKGEVTRNPRTSANLFLHMMQVMFPKLCRLFTKIGHYGLDHDNK